MYMRCIKDAYDSTYKKNALIAGKDYEIFNRVTNSGSTLVQVKDECGLTRHYFSSRFAEIPDPIAHVSIGKCEI